MNTKNKKNHRGVKEILLMGVFWRILFIEGVLLVYSLGYKWLTEDATSMELFWYSVRITLLVIIIIVFMMVTLKQFLTKKIITPLEAIAASNNKIQADFSKAEQIDPPVNVPHEIETIITTRSDMLKTILDVSEDRLRYANALDAELERGKKIQRDFLPRCLPKARNCDIASYFHSALQLSGDFYDVFELPDKHIGFAVGDVSGKGVGSALFMALVRSLLRIFSGALNTEKDLCQFSSSCEGFVPTEALNAVYLTNDYISKEHGEDGMFVTLFFGIIDPLSGKVFYVNGGHEPVMVIGKEGIKRSLDPTGPALGPIEDAQYTMGSVLLEKGDMLFSYSDGVTEARSETKGFYTRARLKNRVNMVSDGTAADFLDRIKTDLFSFIGTSSQSDDITMLAIKWH